MGLIKKFRIKSYKRDETIVELKNTSVFYNKETDLKQPQPYYKKARNSWDVRPKWRGQVNYL